MNDKTPKPPILKNTKMRIIVLFLGVVVSIVVLIMILRWKDGGVDTGSARINVAPQIESLPGVGNPTPNYVKAVQQSNIDQADAASKTNTDSGVPTITRAGYIQSAEDETLKVAGGKCDTASLRKARLAGVTASELRCQGCDVSQIKSAGFSAAQLRSAGFSAAQLKSAGYSASELREAGYSAKEMKAGGYSAAELKEAGYSAADLKAAGFSAKELKDVGFTAAELRSAGFSINDLLEAGFGTKDLLEAGFSPEELLQAGVTLPQLKTAGLLEKNLADLKAKNMCSPDAIRKARAKGATAATLRHQGCGAAALKAAGFSAYELKDAGFSVDDLKAAGFTVAELKAAGFSAAELKNAGFTASELKDSGFTAEELKAAGFTAEALRAAGFAAGDLARAGFTLDELRTSGFTEGDLIRAGLVNPTDVARTCNVSELKKSLDLGDSADELRMRGCDALSLAAAGYDIEALTAAGYSFEEIEAAKTMLVKKVSTGDSSSVPEPFTTGNEELDNLQRLQAEQLALQERQEQREQIEGMMVTQANQLFNQWNPSVSQQFVLAKQPVGEVAATKEQKAQQARATAGLLDSQLAKVKAGDVVFAVMETSVNSDEDSPVMAKIVSGKLKGARLLGKFKRMDKRVLLNFNLISLPNRSKSSSIQAVAIDEKTAKTAVATSVDNHYMLRYGSLFASSFLAGFSKALQGEGTSTVTTSGDAQYVTSKHSNKERGLIALGEVGTQYSAVMGDNFNRQPTIKVASGTGFGLLFTSDVEIPLIDTKNK